MGLRVGLLMSLSLSAISAAAMAQSTPAAQKASSAASKASPKTASKARPSSSAGRVSDPGTPHTLAEALAATYANQPALQAERAKLRATDENVPQALAGWRPTVVLAGTAGYGDGIARAYSNTQDIWTKARTDRTIATAQATVTQNIYTGGKTQASVNRAKNQVYAERATLLAQEQTSFTNAVNAYVGVIQAEQLLELQINNEQVLAKQLQATNDRFRVGEITRTDVAQAEAALEGAKASRETAEGNLQTARGTFVQVIGFRPPDDLLEPQPLALPVKSENEASQLASLNNPNVLTALFNDSAAKDAIDVAFSQLMPQVSVQGQTFQQQNSAGRSSSNNGYAVIAQLSVPANEVALEGVEREAIVGSRTTLDVLNATQTLLNSRTTLVQNLAQVVIASYGVASAIGRLTARDLHLPVPLYDDTAYYNAVKDRWAGLGDYATSQPGR